MAKERMSEKERTARQIYRALIDLSNFSDSQRPEIMRRVVELLRNDKFGPLDSIASFVEPLGMPHVQQY